VVLVRGEAIEEGLVLKVVVAHDVRQEACVQQGVSQCHSVLRTACHARGHHERDGVRAHEAAFKDAEIVPPVFDLNARAELLGHL
jgi:hypothetical protein